MQRQKSLSEQYIVVTDLNGTASCSDENLLEVDDVSSKGMDFQHSNESSPPGPDTESASVATLCKIERSFASLCYEVTSLFALSCILLNDLSGCLFIT